MLILHDAWWVPQSEVLERLFWDLYFQPIYEMASEEPTLYNSRSLLLRAIREGRVSYSDGVWTGRFTAKISRELSKFATFDKRSKTWTGFPPPAILAATVTANQRARALEQRLKTAISGLSRNLDDALRFLTFPIENPLERIDRQLKMDARNIAVLPKITDGMRAKLITDYTQNMGLEIKGWDHEQIVRLREMVERFALNGYRRNQLMDYILREWEVTVNKARFLARQETSLFMSKVRRERYLDAGIRYYRWSDSHDARVRPRHAELHGHVFMFGKPPVVDEKTRRRAEPGEDYNCRCVAIPVLNPTPEEKRMAIALAA